MSDDKHSQFLILHSPLVPPSYKQTEVGVIPEDWEVRPLVGLTSILHGYGFQSQYFKPYGKYRLTTPGHFHETGGFREVGDRQKFYDGPLPDGYLLSDGDLIVVMTEQADGLLGSAALVPPGGNYLHNQRLGKVKLLSPNVSSKFLYSVFNSRGYRAKVRETAAGTKVKHTSPSKLLEIPVALPAHQSRTRSHRRGLERCGCPHRFPGAAHRQKMPDQTRRHAGIAHRQEAPAGIQRGVGGKEDW